ncbi:MAG TPA: LysR family transcriptional regulator [Burkholderiales bacterium]|nr:LysR family transcriptional regulator [Burkholderiales bacterium]
MNVTNLDLNLLRVFDAMMIERNVTRAAPRVHLSQPAASHALARLREAIGDPLFVRSGNEMVPTARALALGPAVRKMLEQLGSVLVGESFDPRLETAAFKIAMVDFAEYLIAPMFSRLIAEEAPHIRLMVSAPEAASLEASLADGELDMALGIFDAAGAGIHSRSLAPLRMVAVVREGHPLAGRRLTAAEFSSVPRLAIASGGDAASTLYERQLAKAGLGGEVVYVTQNFLSVPQVLASTDLALITSERVAQTLCAHKPLVVMSPPAELPPAQMRLIWHDRAHRSPAQKWMRDKLADASSRLGDPTPDALPVTIPLRGRAPLRAVRSGPSRADSDALASAA